MAVKKKGVITKAKAKSGTSVSKGGGIKGVIKKVSGVASMAPGAIGLVGKAVSLGSALFDNSGRQVSGGGKPRHKGLTYREIKGATKVLKLVKKFAPAGSKFKLKSKMR